MFWNCPNARIVNCTVLINERDQLFEIENAQILIDLFFMQLTISISFFMKKGILFKKDNLKASLRNAIFFYENWVNNHIFQNFKKYDTLFKPKLLRIGLK